MIKSKKIGFCIYCGSLKDLSKEHIIPLGLHGDWTLLKASCKNCRDITSFFEKDALRNLFGSVRAFANFRSRHNNYPQSLPVVVVNRDNIEFNLNIPIDEYGGVTMLPIFTLPQHLRPTEAYRQGIDIIGNFLRRVDGLSLANLFAKYDAKSVSFVAKYNPTSFARMIAKIAYGFAIFQYGESYFDNVYILPAILNQKDDIGKWVGSDGNYVGNEDIEIKFMVKGDELWARVVLFGKWHPPNYVVVIGRIKQTV